MAAPYIALPPLESFRSIEIEIDPDYDKNRRRRHRHRNHNNNSKSKNSSNNKDDDINSGKAVAGSGNNGDQSEASSSSSSLPSEDSREFPPAIILPPNVRPIDLTTDHSAYNPAEVTAVLRRCNNAPRAISAGLGGGIKRVAGSLAVTRALGDAYLKTPRLSFFPYKTHTPYITARPEVNCRPLVKGGDKVLMLATDGVWERAGGEDVLRWVRTRNSTVADVIVRRVLNKVRRARNISSLHALMSLPPGRARRSKHDDITVCVVDLSAFIS
eukprot:jgi/Psemu1/263171/estExt_Genewise1Plus.C_9370009